MIEFFKYHGLGNDFVICEGGPDRLSTDRVVEICRRHRGVGADGVLMIGGLDAPADGVRMTVYNRDGTRPEMCGNGIRCAAAYAVRHGAAPAALTIGTDAGDRRCEVQVVGSHRFQVRVQMGQFDATRCDEKLELDGRQFEYVEVDMGNPHAVVFERPDDEIVDRLGRRVNDGHPLFPDGVNLEFVDPDEAAEGWRTVVYERGVGRTQACGTGACAVAAAVWITGRGDRNRPVGVELPGGVLTIGSEDASIWMNGPAEELFSGIWRPRAEDGGLDAHGQ